MKNERKIYSILFIIWCMILTVDVLTAQTLVKTDSAGNYVSATVAKPKVADKLTGSNYVDSKGVIYPIWESAKGKLYYYKVSAKTTKKYKCYIEIQK